MKTWEMLKELMENPKKKFISDKGQKGNEMTAERLQQNIVFRYTNKDVYANCIAVTRDWEEVKEPVTFIEVLEKVKSDNLTIISLERKDLRLGYTRCTLDFILDDLSRLYESNDIAKFLLEGKWYIED